MFNPIVRALIEQEGAIGEGAGTVHDRSLMVE